jgi:hypothetical protein
METKDRDILPLTLDQLETVVDALNTHYARQIRRTNRLEEKTELPRTKETSKKLAHIQETLQYATLMLNIRTHRLNEDVARAGGIALDDDDDDEETASSTGESARQ